MTYTKTFPSQNGERAYKFFTLRLRHVLTLPFDVASGEVSLERCISTLRQRLGPQQTRGPRAADYIFFSVGSLRN